MKLASPDMLTATAIAQRFEYDVGTPIQAMLEISDRCNEVCVHCYQEQGKKGEMDTDEVLALLDELAASGVLFLTISGGEPTLRKDFLQIVEHAHRLGFVMRIFTNGLTMTPAMARALYDAAVEAVEISVYSHRPENHDFVTGVPGSLARTQDGIRALVEAGVMVVMKAPVMSVNEDDLEGYVAMAESLGAHYAFSPGTLHPKEGGARDHQMFNRSEEAHRTLLGHAERLGEFTPVQGAFEKAAEQRPCGAGGSVHVEPNGELRPCTLLELDLGNVRGTGVAETRRSSEPLAGLRSLRWRDLHGCRDCELSGHCAHCYAHALAETGDALGPYPSACQEAKTRYEVANRLPASTAGPGGPPTGPFQVLEDGTCVAKPHEITDRDRERAAQLGWTKRPGGAVPAVSGLAKPGDLVQLRRPGSKRLTSATVPAGPRGSLVNGGADLAARQSPGD